MPRYESDRQPRGSKRGAPKAKGGLQRRWGPLPIWGWGVIGLVGGYEVIKNRNASSGSTSTTGGTATPVAATGDQGAGGAPPSGYRTSGQGGGGAGGGIGQSILSELAAIQGELANTPAPPQNNGGPPGGGGGGTSGNSAASQGAAAGAQVAKGTASTAKTAAKTVTPVTASTIGRPSIGQPLIAPTGPGTFALPKGTLDIKDYKASGIRVGNVVYYPLPNAAVATQARGLGGTLVQGTQVPGGNKGTVYLKR